MACVYASGLIGKSVNLLPSAPRLHITPQPFGDFRIWWGLVFPGYILEGSLTLGPGAAWSAVPEVINNETYVFSTEPRQFYRLRKP